MRFANRPYAAVVVAASIVAAGIGAAQAQSTAASGSVVVLPIVAQTSSYTTEVTVHNPITNTSAITVDIDFYEADTSASPGHTACGSVTVSPGDSTPFSLNGGTNPKCPTFSAGGHFGMLVLTDAAAQKIHPFYAYSRSQTPGGNGFSVEGFPAGAFSGADATVVGLKRQAAAPTYQSNCFAAALGESVTYQLVLHNGSSGATIGATAPQTLLPYEMVRMTDIFAVAGVPAGDVSNVNATFSVQPSGADFPALVGFCTVQESTFFGADFRIAKSIDGLNEGQKRLACIGMDNCTVSETAASTIQPEEITDASLKNVYSMIITQPDFVRCDLVGSRASEMQMQLRGPGDPFTSTAVAGGANQTTFYASTGNRSTVDHGTATRWFVDVSARSGATGTFDFGIRCQSGNGTEIPWFRGTAAKDF